MPVLLKPNQVVTVTLPCESSKPEADRIRWRVRALTCADAIQYEADLRETFGIASAAEQAAKVNAIIKRVAAGWENLIDDQGAAVPFDDAALNLFTAQEKYRVAFELPDAAGWGAVEKKVVPSSSPAGTASAGSAPGAAAAGA